ncbi:MAG: dihydrofolate reductase family protein, partial [Acidimicrobiales bacterium]
MTESVLERPANTLTREPLQLLYERPGAPCWELPAVLGAAYGGEIGFDEPTVYANFVASLDGVAALGPEYPSSGSTISGREPADRFVMALLRVCADVVLIGGGTLRATPGHHWTPSHVWPEHASDFAAVRRSRGRSPEPQLVVVSASGDLPRQHPALKDGAIVATTVAGARHLQGVLPSSALLILGDGPELAIEDVLAAVRSRGHDLVLSEGGPGLLGHLVRAHLLDELFLTVSPVLAGRATTPRPGLIAGAELLPDRIEPAELQ